MAGDGPLDRLEAWSPTLFLIAGAFGLAYASFWALGVFAGMEYPIARDVVFRLTGYVLGYVALLGLYPSLADRRPKLAGAGAVFAVLGLVGWLVDGLAGTSRSLAVYLGADPPAWLGAFAVLILVGFVLGYTSFGVASLGTDVHSRAVGIALLLPLAVTVLNVGIVAGGYTSPTARFVVSLGYALAILAIGVSLRSEGAPSGRTARQSSEVGG